MKSTEVALEGAQVSSSSCTDKGYTVTDENYTRSEKPATMKHNITPDRIA